MSKLAIFASLFLAVTSLALPAAAHEIKVGDLTIIHAHIPQPSATAMAAGGYMGITNGGTTDDALIGVEAPFAKQAMLHSSETTADGVTKMTHIDRLDIPAGQTVNLERGGYHIMLMGLTQTLTEGQMLPATLIFEHAGRVQIEFMVDPANGGAMDHSKMGHTTP